MPARKSIDSEQSAPSGFRDHQPGAISDHHSRHYLHVPAEAAIEVGGWHQSRRREAGVVQRPAHKCFNPLIKELADTIGVVLHHHGVEGLPWQKELDCFDHQHLEPKHWQELQVLFQPHLAAAGREPAVVWHQRRGQNPPGHCHHDGNDRAESGLPLLLRHGPGPANADGQGQL